MQENFRIKDLGGAIKELALKLVYLEPASFNRLKPGELTQEGGRIFIRQFSHFTRNFPRWLAAVASNCPAHDVRKFLAANIHEEEVGISGDGSHYDLLVRQGEGLGLKREEIESAAPQPATLLAINAIDALARNRPWLEGLAATTGLECVNHPEVRREGGAIIINDLRAWRHLGLNEHQLRSRTVHMEGDKEHADAGLNILAAHARTEESRQAVIAAAHAAILAFRTLMEGIGREALGQR